MAQCDYAAETVGRRVYMKARLDYYKLEYYTQLQGVPDCVQKFSYPEYFELLNEYSGAGTVSAVLAVFIALLVALL